MPRNATALAAFALALALAPAAAFAVDCVCIIDEDMLDNDELAIEELADNNVCGGGLPDVCINDQLANPGVRLALPLPVGTVIGNAFWPVMGTQAPLPTGQLFDEGLFKLCEAPQSWVDAGPTANGLINYLVAQSAGFGIGGEFLLDKIPNVVPQRTAELQALVGQSCCAIVYDSDVSINYDPLEGNLQGANLGVIHLTVLAVGQPNGEYLPDITIRIEDPSICQDHLVAVEDGPWSLIKGLYR